MKTSILAGILLLFFATNSFAWDAEVLDILQHGNVVAVWLSPDPGPGNCSVGSPYILVADGTPESNQKFSMLLTALTTGMKISGYPDACTTAIWGNSRPTIQRLHLKK